MTSRPLPELKPTWWDGFIVAAVLLLAAIVVAVFYGDKVADADLTVVVSVGGETVDTIPLSDFPAEPKTYQNNDITLTVAVEDGGICVEKSDCPTQDCVHTGTIRRAGQSIVCLPAQIVIHLEGTADADAPDLIVG